VAHRVLARARAHLTWRYERLGAHISNDVLGSLDLAMPYEKPPWRGPLNGQQVRQQTVRDLAEDIGCVELVVETGSFRGYSTGFLQRTFRCRVWTVESNRRWYAHTRARFLLNRRVTVRHGDSRDQLRQLATSVTRDEVVFAYLDAHWEKELPLRGELSIIASTWRQVAIMIDDFEVADDPGYGYGFDDYGRGKALTAEYLAASAVADWQMFYPAAPSVEENPPRRGCCLLVSPGLGPAELRGFRRAKTGQAPGQFK
jgi:hypothetical protein